MRGTNAARFCGSSEGAGWCSHISRRRRRCLITLSDKRLAACAARMYDKFLSRTAAPLTTLTLTYA